MTTVINIRDKVALAEAKTSGRYLYIGRPSRWANMFSHLPSNFSVIKVDSRDKACYSYEEWFWQNGMWVFLEELKDKTLGCFCKPKRCHGDFLANLTNEVYGE